MNRTAVLVLGALGALAVLPAQPFRCDWSIVGTGGGEMSSASFRCGATAGQTAAGEMASSRFLAFIGYWQADYDVGTREERPLPGPGGWVTRLEAVAPNPFTGRTAIRYSLAAGLPVTLRIHDLAGRVVRTLLASGVERGAYSLVWDGRDDAGRRLAPGIYFCRFRAGDVGTTEKLVLAR